MAAVPKVDIVDAPERAGVNRVDRPDLSTYLQRALIRLGLQAKHLEHTWGVDKAYVSRVLANHTSLPDYRIAQLDAALQRAILAEWAAELGISVGLPADLTAALNALARIASVNALHFVPMRMAKAEDEQ